ncbi:MAG: ComF family protein [Oscillospiraceae bacterium]|jgi:ComF family protein|nr:ComF family protein [Oscillospiraceae bacterium]
MLDLLLPKRCAFCRKVTPGGLCDACQKTLPWRSEPYDGTVAAPLSYRGPVRLALHRYKFRGASGCAGIFGKLMAQAVADARLNPGIVTWVPCSFARRWTRGYDQARKLAKRVCAELGLPLERMLRKTRHTRSQTKMPDEAARRVNVKGAFAVLAKKSSAAGKHILLVDDIRTTGATLDECKRLLLEAGAESVVCCVVAAKG